MLVTSSQAVRSLVVRLNKGEDLGESLASLIGSQRITVATVSGHGVLEAIILDAYDARSRAYSDARTFTGRLELLSLTGHLSTREGNPDLYLHAAVARDTGNGVEVLGGRLIEAQVIAVELTLLLHDDLSLERSPEATGIPTWRVGAAPAASASVAAPPRPSATVAPAAVESAKPRRAPEVTSVSPRRPTAAPPVSLAEVAQQLQTMPAKEERAVDDEVPPEMSVGDVVEHPTFGEAQVVGVQEDRCDIRLVRSGSVRTIMLDYLDVSPLPPRDGVSVWKLSPRKAR